MHHFVWWGRPKRSNHGSLAAHRSTSQGLVGAMLGKERFGCIIRANMACSTCFPIFASPASFDLMLRRRGLPRFLPLLGRLPLLLFLAFSPGLPCTGLELASQQDAVVLNGTDISQGFSIALGKASCIVDALSNPKRGVEQDFFPKRNVQVG